MEKAQKPQSRKQGVKELPTQPVQPSVYAVKSTDVAELVNAINELVLGKFAKKVMFDIINSSFKPLPEPESEKKK